MIERMWITKEEAKEFWPDIPKVEIIPNDLKDTEIAKQLSDIVNFTNIYGI
jgi:hypothetical protein